MAETKEKPKSKLRYEMVRGLNKGRKLTKNVGKPRHVTMKGVSILFPFDFLMG